MHLLKRRSDGGPVSMETIAGNLHARLYATCQIPAERPGRPEITGTDMPGRNQLRIRADRRPNPNLAGMLSFGPVFVLLPATHETPHLIHLKGAAGQIDQVPALIGVTRLPGFRNELEDRVLGRARDPASARHGIAFDKTLQDTRPFFHARFDRHECRCICLRYKTSIEI